MKIILKMTCIVMSTMFSFFTAVYSQNVGINATGANPDASAQLDVNSATHGMLIPRVSLTSANTAGPITLPAHSLLVYNTATAGLAPNNVTPGYYYNSGTTAAPIWTRLATGVGGTTVPVNDDWKILGNNNTVSGTNFLGTTNAQALDFRTNSINRMRILDGGRIGMGTNIANSYLGMLQVEGSFQSSGANSNAGIIYGRNNHSSGTGVVGVGHNAAWNALSSGSGGSFVGLTTGAYSFYTTPNIGQGIAIQDDYGAQWLVGHYNGAAYRKIVGNGTVSTVVRDVNNEMVMMNCPETPENLFFDYGIGKLENGRARITIDPILKKNILVDEEHPLKVFIQLEDECNGVYVSNKSSDGFDVIELGQGVSSATFSYKIVATMGDQEMRDKNGELIRVAKYGERWEKAPDLLEKANSTNN